MGGITTKMKRIIDIDKLQEAETEKTENLLGSVSKTTLSSSATTRSGESNMLTRRKRKRLGHYHPSLLLLYHLRKFVRI